MAGLRISVFSSKELAAVILRMKAVPTEVASQVNRFTRNDAEPIWQQEVSRKASDRLETAVLANTARVAVGRGNVTLKAGGIGRALAGGAKPPQIALATEFGANRDQFSRYQAVSRKGTRYAVTRRTARQFKPRNPRGYVAYPAAAKVIPRIASLWVQTVVRTLHEAIEGK